MRFAKKRIISTKRRDNQCPQAKVMIVAAAETLWQEKRRRQEAFLAQAEASGLSCEEAIAQAQLIPDSVVAECKVLRWAR